MFLGFRELTYIQLANVAFNASGSIGPNPPLSRSTLLGVRNIVHQLGTRRRGTLGLILLPRHWRSPFFYQIYIFAFEVGDASVGDVLEVLYAGPLQ